MQVTCLPASASAPYFTIQTNDLCAVAVYTAPDLAISAYGALPTWGRHGGPLTSTVMKTGTNADVHVERWSLAGMTLTKAETKATLSGVSASAFFTSQLLDLPVASESVIAWSGQAFATDGKAHLLTDTMAKSSYVATGVLSFGAMGPDVNGISRLLYTGTSAFNGPTNNMVGLYAADFHADGSLDGTPAAVSLWGEANGPVAVDGAGNALAINTKFSDGTQELRGFDASKIKPLSPPTAGDVLLDTTGFGSSLAALAPSGAKPGLAIFQPEIGMGTYQDVVVVRYTASMGKLTPTPVATLLKLAKANTTLTLMTDPQDRVWVGAANPSAMGSTFVVLARP